MIPPLHLDMYQSICMAVLALLLGSLLRQKIKFLERFCIPSPVVGGLVFALITCLLYALGIAEVSFDATLQEVCMVLFFTSMGFQADVRQMKSGGRSLLLLILAVTVLIILQNGTSIGLAVLSGQSPLTGMGAGSISMVGGHGTAAAFGPLLEEKGFLGGNAISSASATFGLIAGSLIGGPLGNSLIRKKQLLATASPLTEEKGPKVSAAKPTSAPSRYGNRVTLAVFQLLIAIGIGTLFNYLLRATGLPFPVYIGSLLAAAVIRNAGVLSGKYEVYLEEISGISDICLGLFLGMAMISLKLWQLASLALPLILMLLGQTLLMLLYARFAVFPLLGRNYDAAILAAGLCGCGMGATPNAMANARVLIGKYTPSPKALFLLPLVGCVFTDIINSLLISLTLNML